MASGIRTDDFSVVKPPEKLGELEVPQGLRPVKSERHVLVFLNSTPGLGLDVDAGLVVLKGEVQVEERPDFISTVRIRIDIPVGQEACTYKAAHTFGDTLQTIRDLSEKVVRLLSYRFHQSCIVVSVIVTLTNEISQVYFLAKVASYKVMKHSSVTGNVFLFFHSGLFQAAWHFL